MKRFKKVGLGLLALSVGLSLVGCGKGGNKAEAESVKKDDYSVALVTDVGGVDDKSFNQSAWEGLQSWGKSHDRQKGNGGYTYYQSNTDAEFMLNLNSAIDDDFNLNIGVGFKLQPALEETAAANSERQFVIIDSVIENQKNVLSVVFEAQESSYLAGIAAAMTTKTNKLGFIGGQEGEVIGLFEAGFVAGAKSVNPNIEVLVQYAGTFGEAAKGKSIASAMYHSGADVIFHAAGDTGNGVFSEAVDIMETKPANPVWVVGVDLDQQAEGKYNGGNVTLTSALKSVSSVTELISNNAMEGKFPGGTTQVYGLADGGVDITDGQLSKEILAKVKEAKEGIIAGTIKVPKVPEKK